MTALPMEALWDLINELGMSIRLCVAGFCLYCLLDGLVYGRRFAAGIAALYTGLLLTLYWIPFEFDSLYVYVGVTALTAILACRLTPRTKRRFTAFLCITFYALREISITVSGSVYSWLYDTVILGTARAWNPLWETLAYAACVTVYVLLLALFLLLAIKAIRHAYPARKTNLTWRDFWLLCLPSFASAIASPVLAVLRYPLTSTADYDTASFWSSILQLVLFGTILGTVTLFAAITNEQQRRSNEEALRLQMSDLRQYTSDLETLYANLRAFRHDIANHLETLSTLSESGDPAAAASYAQASLSHLSAALPAVQTGDPVSDVILSALHMQAAEKGIRFTCEFRTPGPSVDPFDLGVIVHNAGLNAIEGAQGTRDPFVRVSSYRHRGMFVMEFSNSCSTDLHLTPGSTFPETSKSGDTSGHGFGLLNIRTAASRYHGECSLTAADGICTLHVMLMLPDH